LPQTSNLPISISQVARVTDMSHGHPAQVSTLTHKFFLVFYTFFFSVLLEFELRASHLLSYFTSPWYFINGMCLDYIKIKLIVDIEKNYNAKKVTVYLGNRAGGVGSSGKALV
jgi:hypothetical protein